MKRWGILIALAAMLAGPTPAEAHAFPLHAVPGAGAVLARAPGVVTIRFDAELEPLFSRLVVKDEQGAQVSEGQGQVDARDATTIFTRLSSLRTGTYHVYWSVVSRDGHRTEGDYTFTVR
jgi:copper resistance protein C